MEYLIFWVELIIRTLKGNIVLHRGVLAAVFQHIIANAAVYLRQPCVYAKRVTQGIQLFEGENINFLHRVPRLVRVGQVVLGIVILAAICNRVQLGKSVAVVGLRPLDQWGQITRVDIVNTPSPPLHKVRFA